MTNVGNIYSLFYTTTHEQTSAKELFLDENGVLKDKHYGKNIERSVLLTSLDSYELVRNNGVDIAYGTLGENILMDYNPYHLTVGTRIKIGSVTLMVSQHGTLCKGLTNVHSKLPKLLKDGRGIFVKVIKLGSIKEGVAIYLLD